MFSAARCRQSSDASRGFLWKAISLLLGWSSNFAWCCKFLKSSKKEIGVQTAGFFPLYVSCEWTGLLFYLHQDGFPYNSLPAWDHVKSWVPWSEGLDALVFVLHLWIVHSALRAVMITVSEEQEEEKFLSQPSSVHTWCRRRGANSASSFFLLQT